MSERRKKVLAVLASLLIVCGCCSGLGFWAGTFFDQFLVTDPVELKVMGREIATYILPDSYSEVLGFNFMEVKSVALAKDVQASDTVIFLMQVPPFQGQVSEAQAEQQLRTLVQQLNLQPLDFSQERVENRVINDQEVEVIFNQAADNDGQGFKQMLVFLDSSQGKVFLMAQGSEALWDQEELDNFLNSVR